MEMRTKLCYVIQTLYDTSIYSYLELKQAWNEFIEMILWILSKIWEHASASRIELIIFSQDIFLKVVLSRSNVNPITAIANATDQCRSSLILEQTKYSLLFVWVVRDACLNILLCKFNGMTMGIERNTWKSMLYFSFHFYWYFVNFCRII